jgi:cyclopropane fatty-acyl-phospholipid synthase-like methyltransferase
MTRKRAKDYSARDYHEFMLASESDRGLRLTFQRAVLARLAPGATILDFGAGTGIDAKVYAARGHRVHTYDASREMRDFLSEDCRAEIETSRVSVLDLDFDALLKLKRVNGATVDAITANFAVFNLVRDHAPLFEAFDRWLSPKGFILIAAISPYHLADVRYKWWWRHLSNLVFSGRYDLRTGDDLTYRFGISAMKRAAAPHFVLDRIIPSAPLRHASKQDLDSPAVETSSCGPLFLCMHHFMFLLFRRH